MNTKATALVLTASARSAIASTFIDALNSAENTGSLVTQVCDTANKYTRGVSMSDEDMTNIVHSVAKDRGWKGPSAKSRMSEVRVVLKASPTLPEAIKGYASRAHKCDWHTSMRLARCINKGESVKSAIAHTFAKKDQSPKSTPQGRTAGALKAWFRDARADKKALILKAAEILGLKLGVKLDA